MDRTKPSHNFSQRTEVTTSITLMVLEGAFVSMDLALELSGSPFTVGVVEKEPPTNPQETPNTDLGPPLISVCVPKSGGLSASRLFFGSWTSLVSVSFLILLLLFPY